MSLECSCELVILGCLTAILAQMYLSHLALFIL